uniref:Ig-like domain-containing protein n=1 Tax=Magallana gigas TaxID=29159 RepID=K1R757_MAGGI
MILKVDCGPQFHNYQSAAVIPPSFNPTRRNVTYHVGETALLECSVDNLGTKEMAPD